MVIGLLMGSGSAVSAWAIEQNEDDSSVGADEGGPASPDDETQVTTAERLDAAEEDAGETFPGVVEGDIALVSDYIDRGLTNSDHKPAVQGGLTYSIDTGVGDAAFYAGIWGSNVDFDDGDEANIELDWSFGLEGTIPTTEIGWDIGATYYHYPGADHRLNYDYWEIPLALNYTVLPGVTLSGTYYYSPDYSGDTGQAHYVNGSLSWDVVREPVTVTLAVATGHQWIAENVQAGIPDYQDWSVGVTVGFDVLTVGVQYTDTDIPKNKCYQGTNMCEPRVTVKLGASF